MNALCKSFSNKNICHQCGNYIPDNLRRTCPKYIETKKLSPVGLGTKVARLISRLGYKKKCIPCSRREEKINRFGRWVNFTTLGLWNAFKRMLSKSKPRKKLIRSKESFHVSQLQSNPLHAELKKQRSEAMLAQQPS